MLLLNSFMDYIYLDYAAATPVDDTVKQAMEPFYREVFFNPSATYEGARAVKRALEDARSVVSSSIGARPSEITFTAGGTESANMAISGVMNQFPHAKLLMSAIEHDAVIKPAERFNVGVIPVDKTGLVSVDTLATLVSDDVVLISVMLANNEVGTIQPIKEIVDYAHIIKRDRKSRGLDLPLYIHTDACQAPLYLDVDVSRLGVDLMTLNGGKIYGPKQSGILYHRASVSLQPIILGGGQESGLRSGTENVAQSIGFANALQLAMSRRVHSVKAVSELSNYFISELEQQFGAVVNGHRKKRLPNNVHVTIAGCDNERVLFSLDDQGVWAAAGSACQASKDEPSHVLRAMGITAEDAQSSLRFTLGRQTTRGEIDRALEALVIALSA